MKTTLDPDGSMSREPTRHRDTVAALEMALTAAVSNMVSRSPRMTEFAGGAGEIRRMLDSIENVWLRYGLLDIHIDFHPAASPKATIVFQPGSGAHARFYFLLGGLLAARGYHVLAIDRPGHGLSEGARGECTIAEAIGVSRLVIDHARSQLGLPTVLMGSSMGGLLTVFGLLKGLQPDLAIAHNFIYPGKLFSMRLRARWIERRRSRPYPLTELVHGFTALSNDPAISEYLRDRSDPGAAWELSARSVASLFGFSAAVPTRTPPTLVITGAQDRAIPAWATRFFTWWSGLPHHELRVLPNAGHLLFHDHLDVSVPAVTDWLDKQLGAA
jgi:alpha-beta hydrolase superfamily lysophospholipase